MSNTGPGWADKEDGMIFYDRREYEKAVKSFTSALGQDHTEPSFYTGRGMSLIQLKQYSRALKDGQSAVKLSPENPKAHMIMGLSYRGLGMMAKAILSFKKTLELKGGPDADLEQDIETLEQELRAKLQTDDDIALFGDQSHAPAHTTTRARSPRASDRMPLHTPAGELITAKNAAEVEQAYFPSLYEYPSLTSPSRKNPNVEVVGEVEAAVVNTMEDYMRYREKSDVKRSQERQEVIAGDAPLTEEVVDREVERAIKKDVWTVPAPPDGYTPMQSREEFLSTHGVARVHHEITPILGPSRNDDLYAQREEFLRSLGINPSNSPRKLGPL